VLKAQQNNLITRLVKELIPNGIVVLQYADDTIVYLEHDVEKAKNVKLLLYMFEQMLGLKINFEKSEIVLVGGDNSIAMSYADIFNCQIRSFHLNYLGVPIAASRLHVADWFRFEENG
jgi:hypothetical protein